MHALLLIAALLAPSPAAAAEIAWVYVGAPGNPPDAAAHCLNGETDCGSVATPYAIGRYEVTNAAYAEFLNAVAATDTHGLFSPEMEADANGAIARSGDPGAHAYAVEPGREHEPVVFVSWYDAVRFANWLHHGQPSGAQDATTTEDGAYTLTPEAIAANAVVRNEGAAAFLPSEAEWYKAAYYDRALARYYGYPAASNAPPVSEPPPGGAGSANFFDPVTGYALTGASGPPLPGIDYLTSVGAYAASPSPFGTFDQGGNVFEWNETARDADRGIRGGSWSVGAEALAASSPRVLIGVPTGEHFDVGFRVARPVPEPAPPLLALAGALALARARRRSA